MTTTDSRTEFDARAAESGAGATAVFKNRQISAETSPERIRTIANDTLAAIHDVLRKHELTYDEFNAFKAWMIQLGEDGEVPLFLDVWVEHVVEDINTAHRDGSKGSILGPYYVEGAPEIGPRGTLSMRTDEPGTPLTWTGRVASTTGEPLPGAVCEVWMADANGFYSQFAPGLPEWNLRGTVTTDNNGEFEIRCIQPAPYQIPTDGACGKFIAAAELHAWRPAHIHVRVTAEGHETLVTQLYFPGDAHNDDDVASAVKPELMLDPTTGPDGTATVEYSFTLDSLTK